MLISHSSWYFHGLLMLDLLGVAISRKKNLIFHKTNKKVCGRSLDMLFQPASQPVFVLFRVADNLNLEGLHFSLYKGYALARKIC